MKILIVGSGGREHVLVWKIAQSSKVEKIYCAPGNGGTDNIAINVDIASDDVKSLADFAQEKEIDLTVVGPEAALAAGIADEFNKRNLNIFGPNKKGAQLESSKVFAKKFMQKYGIPTANFKVFQDKDKAIEYIRKADRELVVKADGLAAGKGVYVCGNCEEAEDAVKKIMVDKKFGASGDKILVEDKLIGEEASMIVLCDGKNILPLASSQDHKAIYDKGEGPNTGGMGAYSPAPVLEGKMFDITIDKIVNPLVEGVKNEIKDYKGVLYVGLIVTNEGPQVLEFNVRFGDPELQAIVPRLKSDFLNIIESTTKGNLDGVNLEWDDRFCVCVIMVSEGYPGKYEKGKIIKGLKKFDKNTDDIMIFHAGTRQFKEKGKRKKEEVESMQEKRIVTNGGRVLGVTALGKTIEEAINKSYDAIKEIEFEGAYFRKDIGRKALTYSFRK